jgi:hypothetical protein
VPPSYGFVYLPSLARSQCFRLRLEKGLDASFSKVKYRDIAPRVGLAAGLAGDDMETFDIHRARIPTSMFKAIVEDLEIMMKQYGQPNIHKNGEARSRFLAPVSFPSADVCTYPRFSYSIER